MGLVFQRNRCRKGHMHQVFSIWRGCPKNIHPISGGGGRRCASINYVHWQDIKSMNTLGNILPLQRTLWRPLYIGGKGYRELGTDSPCTFITDDKMRRRNFLSFWKMGQFHIVWDRHIYNYRVSQRKLCNFDWKF